MLSLAARALKPAHAGSARVCTDMIPAGHGAWPVPLPGRVPGRARESWPGTGHNICQKILVGANSACAHVRAVVLEPVEKGRNRARSPHSYAHRPPHKIRSSQSKWPLLPSPPVPPSAAPPSRPRPAPAAATRCEENKIDPNLKNKNKVGHCVPGIFGDDGAGDVWRRPPVAVRQLQQSRGAARTTLSLDRATSVFMPALSRRAHLILATQLSRGSKS